MVSKIARIAGVGATVAALGVAGMALAPQDAQACGGLFCNTGPQQVNQAAERIIFIDREDGTVTAVVQIQYQGEADGFSWVLPVPGVPTVEVSSNLAFQRLQNATNPTYNMVTQIEGECQQNDFANGAPESDDGFDPSPDAEPGMEPGVDVLDSGSVGPYDYEVISVENAGGDVAQVAIEWLTDNGYDVTDIGPDVLRPYLLDGMNLIAFRLTKQADAGSIRPVRLTYESDSPMIPIKPTAVAANDDMGIMTFIGAPSRAVPTNYRHLVLNDAAINWFNPASNYNDVINLAADQAGGQGFVTEFAGDSINFSETIFGENERANADQILGTNWVGREGELLFTAIRFYGFFDGYTDVLREAVPTPEGVQEAEFLECPACFYNENTSDIEGMEIDLFLQSLEDNVIEPMRATQELIDEMPYMTRLFTTMSDVEMTLDPAFDFNADLADHDNLHTATRIIECSPDVSQFDAPWRIEFENGITVRGQFQNWPVGTEDLPANNRIEQLDGEGQAEVIVDNTARIRQELTTSNSRFPSAGDNGSTDDGCACSTPTAPAGTPGLPAALIALAFGALIVSRRS